MTIVILLILYFLLAGVSAAAIAFIVDKLGYHGEDATIIIMGLFWPLAVPFITGSLFTSQLLDVAFKKED